MARRPSRSLSFDHHAEWRDVRPAGPACAEGPREGRMARITPLMKEQGPFEMRRHLEGRRACPVGSP